ncbi:MAG: PAS domain S-box protein, partial [Candidatus Thorarchaeota archaeon]|nr:PAS domain S-box protein [Candidatus Thorarchaeota archaeon]
MNENFRLLLVEDNPGDVRLIQEYLKDVPLMNFELGVVDTLEKAQKMLKEGNIDLVLLDLELPDSTGFDTVNEVIGNNPLVPVVVLTGLFDHRLAMEVINGGAQDYLVKDLINTDILARSIRYSIHRKQSQVEIEQSELKYRSLWDNSANGLAYHELVTDDDGKPIDSIFLDVNTSFEKITGLKREDLIGKRLSEVKPEILPTDNNPATMFGKVALTGEPMSIEFHNHKIQHWFSVSVYSPSRGTFVCALDDITEKRKAEESLRLSVQKYRILYEKLSDALFLSDIDGRITLANDMAVELFGYNKDEIRGIHFTELLHPEDHNRIMASHEKHLKTGESITGGFEAKARRKNGSYFDVHITNTILMEEGKYSGYQSLIHDITNRKINERQIQESEEKYRTLFESAQDGIFIIKDSVFAECNDEGLKIFGCTKEQIVGKKPFHFSPPVQPDGRGSKEKSLELIGLALTGEPQRFEWLHSKNDGTPFYTSVSLNAFSLRGEVVLQTIIRDITELKKAEVELRESEKLYRLLAENTLDCIWQIDLNAKFIYVNQAVFQVFGFTPEEWIGSQVYEHCSPEVMKLISDKMLEVITQGSEVTPITFETHMFRKDGTEIDVEITGNLIIDKDKEPLGFQGTTRDITERKKAEKALRESEREKSTILNTMDDLVVYYSSPVMKIEWTNQAAAKSVNMSVDELIGESCCKIWHQRDKPLESCPVVQAFKTGRLEEAETTSPDGRSWTVVGSPVKDDEGHTIGVVKVSRDITEKKQAEDALRESEERHRMVLSSMSDMIFVIDENNNYIEFYASNQFAPIVPPEVFIGKNVVEILPSEVAQRIVETANRVRETGNREELEYLLMKENERSWYSTVFDMHQNSDSIIQTVRNITLRKNAEDNVKERESEYRTLVSNIPGAVYHCSFDKHWTMFFLSDIIEDITGYPASDFIMNQTRSFDSIIHPDDRKHVVDETTKSVSQKESYTLEYRIIGEDGMIRCIRDYGQGIPGPDKQVGYLDGILFDVTNEKLAQDEMVRLREVQQASFELSLALGETLELDKIYKIVHKHVVQVMDTSIFIVSYYDKKS